jgi:diphthine-ammonia ligase
VQAESIGVPLVQKAVSADMQKYEEEFKEAVKELIPGAGIKNMVFGDIYLTEHKDWVERVCNDLNIHPVEPLWGISAESIVKEFINSGFKSVIVSCKSDIMGEEFIGRCIDEKLLAELKKKNICPCGENGEFHTFVIDGPIFKNRIEITESRSILKKGFWEHWFLDIKKYELHKKETL